MPLLIAPQGKEMKIIKIIANGKIRRHLCNLGLTIGSYITSIQRTNHDVIILTRDCRLALNKSLAMKIIVN